MARPRSRGRKRWFGRLGWLGTAALTLALQGCPASSAADGGIDAGLDGGDGGSPDGGDGGVICADAGVECFTGLPCCDTVHDYCDPSTNLCLPIVDAGTGGTTGGTTGGLMTGLPADSAKWQAESVGGTPVASLVALSAPSPGLVLAVGNAPGGGALFVRSADAGWSAAQGLPTTSALHGLWADSAGNIALAGEDEAGAGLLLVGSLDAGFVAASLDGGPAFLRLRSVVGLGPREWLAVGDPVDLGTTSALHLLPDGGLLVEPLPGEFASTRHLLFSDGGVLAVGIPYGMSLPSAVLLRQDEGWSLFPQIDGLIGGNLNDLAIGPDGAVTAVGDDGQGNGLVFTLTDAGFAKVTQFPALPPYTAVSEPTLGNYFFAVAQGGQAAILRLDAGFAHGILWQEAVPAGATQINAIAGDGAGGVFAAGIGACIDGCAGTPLALERVGP